ncbi:MAG TPA: type IV pilus secretin PilQ, partial [Blastocatellia bacterium]|nr:type IV pilus secretin PilQ [Blastocatellia bacterium]
AMTIRRPIAILSLLALVGNLSVFAKTNGVAEPQSFALMSLKHETVGSLTRILVESSAPPLYTVFRPTDRLILVDLPGGEASHLAPSYSVKSALVDQVVVRQSQPDGGSGGRAVARLEVNVRPDARDRSTVNGNTFVLEISPDGQSAPPQDRKEAKPVSQPRNDSRADSPGVAVYSAPVSSRNADPRRAEPVAEKVNPQPSALKPATVVRSVRSEASGGGVRVVIDTDGVAQFKDFVLSDPLRIVVDITGVHSAVGNKTTAVGAASVDRLRVGQPSPNVVRVVLDTKSKVPYRVVREGSSLVIAVGNLSSSRENEAKPNSEVRAQQNSTVDAKAQDSANAVKQAAESQHKPEVKVAGDRVENKTDQKKSAEQPANLIAQSNSSNSQTNTQRVTAQPNRSLPNPTPTAPRTSAEPKSQPAQPSVTRSVLDAQRSTQAKRSEMAFCDPGYVGGLISFDLRAGVDIRDMLRFISQQYGVNFIVDKSVGAVPVDLRVTDRPWNQVMDSVLRANRLGAVCENGGMIRIATLQAVKEEEEQQRAIQEEKAKQLPLVTRIIHLKYARAAGQLGATGAGASGRSGSSGGTSSSSGGIGAGSGITGQGSLIAIVNSRLSPRGRTEVDVRTNSLIVTDLPEHVQVIEDMIAKLDHPEPQVEIEARIVIASRNFLRDIGSELAAANVGKNGRGGLFETTPVQLVGSGLQPGGNTGGSGGGSGGSSGGSGSGSGGSGSNNQKGLGPNLVGPFADTSLRAGVANTVLSLTTGALGTGLLSMALSASETKGQVRTIASPRVTTTDNKTAEIVNGVQIPVQTVSNNTITTTFVTAALRLEITPQIIEENGQVLMHVVAENNTVNFQLANQFNNGTPGINTQSAESTVLVQDGGTTVMGGINIDSEGHSINRTPGLSRIPLMGEMFKHRSTRRDADEILFFLTPRIVRNDGTLGPRAPQRSSVEGMPNPNQTQRAVTPTQGAPDSKAATTTGGASGKGGH